MYSYKTEQSFKEQDTPKVGLLTALTPGEELPIVPTLHKLATEVFLID